MLPPLLLLTLTGVTFSSYQMLYSGITEQISYYSLIWIKANIFSLGVVKYSFKLQMSSEKLTKNEHAAHEIVSTVNLAYLDVEYCDFRSFFNLCNRVWFLPKTQILEDTEDNQ